MNNERYQNVRASTDNLEYKFTSSGKHGEIEKVIQYKKIDPALPDLYNLGFGHLTGNGNYIDDHVRADNGDMMKVLSTVAFTVNDFIAHYPDKAVYIRGSDPVRTRVYQIAINKHYEEITKDYEIYGHLVLQATDPDELIYYHEPFQKNKNYIGFLIVKK